MLLFLFECCSVLAGRMSLDFELLAAWNATGLSLFRPGSWRKMHTSSSLTVRSSTSFCWYDSHLPTGRVVRCNVPAASSSGPLLDMLPPTHHCGHV